MKDKGTRPWHTHPPSTRYPALWTWKKSFQMDPRPSVSKVPGLFGLEKKKNQTIKAIIGWDLVKSLSYQKVPGPRPSSEKENSPSPTCI